MIKNHSKKFIAALLISGTLFNSINLNAQETNLNTIGRNAIARNSAKIEFSFNDKGVKLGNQIFLRVFKDKSRLELWVKAKNNKFKYIRQYKICGANSLLIPTGIYYISGNNLWAGNSKILKIATDFPNVYNIEKKQRGAINIAPFCANAPEIGLTDPEMDELYTIIYRALKAGQGKIEIQILPFELNQFNLFSARNKPNFETLKQLAPIYTIFENSHNLPKITISKAGYKIKPSK